MPGQRLCPVKSHSCLSPVLSTKQGLNQLQLTQLGRPLIGVRRAMLSQPKQEQTKISQLPAPWE